MGLAKVMEDPKIFFGGKVGVGGGGGVGGYVTGRRKVKRKRAYPKHRLRNFFFILVIFIFIFMY